MDSRWPSEPVVVEVARGPLGEAVLARAAGAVAVRCDLPLDRLEDAVLVLGALLSGAAPDGEALEVRFEPWSGAMAIRAGPYADGEAQRVLAARVAPDAAVVAGLAGAAHIESDGRGDFISLVIAAGRAGANLL